MARGGPRRLIGRISPGMPRVAANDPQEQQKRARLRQQQPQLRSRRPPSTPALERGDELHPWWRHLPADQQLRRHRWRLHRLRFLAWLKRKPQRIAATVLVYALICALPFVWSLPLVSLVAALPLLLVPPLAGLVYWLVWQEFHS